MSCGCCYRSNSDVQPRIRSRASTPLRSNFKRSMIPPELKTTVSIDAIFRKWPAYACEVRDKLLIGASTYGDASFKRKPQELLTEVMEELKDVSGWAFILWCRCQDLLQELKEKEDAS